MPLSHDPSSPSSGVRPSRPRECLHITAGGTHVVLRKVTWSSQNPGSGWLLAEVRRHGRRATRRAMEDLLDDLPLLHLLSQLLLLFLTLLLKNCLEHWLLGIAQGRINASQQGAMVGRRVGGQTRKGSRRLGVRRAE